VKEVNLAKIVKKDKFFKAMSVFFFGLFGLLLAGALSQSLAAGLPDLPEQRQGTSSEEVTGPVGRSGADNLYPSQRELGPLGRLDSLRRVTHRARPGDTLAKLLSRFGLSKDERLMWLRSIQKHRSMKGLRPGQVMHFYFTVPDRSQRGQKEHLKALEIELNEDSILTWEKGTKGIFFSKRERPYEVQLKTVGGVVESSLFEDGARAGLNQKLLSQLADIFSWEIDFDKDIKKGDTFKLLYEERSRKNKKTKTPFRILAAELINAGEKYNAIYFEKNKGKGNYYDLDGRSLARAFLRFALEFASISSYFAHSRFHPLLKFERPHNGVDFVAKRGTPVRAIGDGRIVHAGWRKGGYGRMIQIQHNSVYGSGYAHLQRVAHGIRKGVDVKKGRIIGYVGCSGLCKGPHLHFELYKDQYYVDPLKFESPPEDRIEPAVYRAFENVKQLFLAELAATPSS
jgi:murein DD-endopeptidase MepM/ murein hydrolase activator NlpD